MRALCLGVLLLLSLVGISGQCLLNTTYPNRLPSSVLPLAYSLNFTLASPNDANGDARTSYSGAVSVSLSIQNATTCIVLHAASSLQILDARLNQDGTITKPDQILSNSTYEFLILQFSQPIPTTPKSSVLSISFNGKVNPDSAAGLFICENTYDPSELGNAEKKRDLLKRAPWASSKHHEKKKRLRRSSAMATEMMYATQFEETSARMAFPCWDEPGLKATYQTSITIPSGQNLTVLNNWPLDSRTTSAANEIWTFAQSPHVMSSYLVAWAVGRFDYVEGSTDDGVLIRVYTPVGMSQYGTYALNITIASLQYFRGLWNMSYLEMSKKLDNIAVPGIDEDAMENWGLCTYSPELLLADPANLTRDLIQLPAQVVSHELSHQWFGDTITMPYWNQIYLNEGFARLWEYVFVDHYYPDWYVFWVPENSIFGPTDFYDFVYNPCMLDDYTGSYPPIIVDEDQTPVSAMFYAKGASVNYMMMKFLGFDAWNSALAYHFAHHKWTNPDVNDLMNSFEAVGLHISAQWLTWLMQSSLPVVVLSLDDSTNLLTATQKPISSLTPSNQLWWVNLPIHAVSTSDSTKVYDTEIQFSSPTTTAQLPTGFQWNIFGNNNYTNFYVVNYNQPRQWTAALEQLESPSFSAVDIQQLERLVFLLTNRF